MNRDALENAKTTVLVNVAKGNAILTAEREAEMFQKASVHAQMIQKGFFPVLPLFPLNGGQTVSCLGRFLNATQTQLWTQ